MAPAGDDTGGDRRNIDRRIDALERRYEVVAGTVGGVQSEQKLHADIMALSFKGVEARCNTLDRGNDLIMVKIDKLVDTVNEAIGDPQNSPMGRSLLKDIVEIRKAHEASTVEVRDLKEEAAELRGALKFLRNSNLGAVIIALAALIVVLVRMILASGAGK